ncbi:hypothetical protein GCM10017688_44520 [Streptomyces ramulosus]
MGRTDEEEPDEPGQGDDRADADDRAAAVGHAAARDRAERPAGGQDGAQVAGRERPDPLEPLPK